MNNVLVYCPLHPFRKPSPYPQTRQSISALEWGGRLTVVYDQDFDFPEDDPWHSLTRHYNEARQMALNGGYDALLTIEHDMVVPADAVQKLDAVQADVVYGLYVARHMLNDRWRWLSFMAVDDDYQAIAYNWLLSYEDMNQHLVNGDVMPSAGAGFGCTYIRRPVLADIEFRDDPLSDVLCDWVFGRDLVKAGYRQMHHWGVQCGHILDEHSIVYPAVNEQMGIVREL